LKELSSKFHCSSTESIGWYINATVEIEEINQVGKHICGVITERQTFRERIQINLNMGQCAPSSPLEYSMDDDEHSFVVTPPDDDGCHVGLPYQRIFQNHAEKSTNKRLRNSITYDEFDNNSDNKERKKFLQAHQPDIPQRCIVDQHEIKRVIWLQSDELLRRQGMLKMHGMSVDEVLSQQILPIARNQICVGANVIENEGDDDRKSIFSEPSIVSGITSASNTTVVRKNTKRKSKNEKKRDTHLSTYAASSPPQHNLSNVIKRETANFNRVAISDHPSIPNHITGKDLERRQFISVLRLKMKANIGWFYTQRYLKMFPSELKPIVGKVPRKERGIPGLTCESSNSSFSSGCSSSRDDTHCIDYGSMPPISPVICPVTKESFFDLATTGCLGLVPREQDHKALRSSRRQLRDHYEKSRDHCIVLINKRSGSPLAVCALKATSGSPVVRIYATRQMAFAQKPTATTRQLGLDWADDLPLYTWAEVKSEGDYLDEINFTVFMVKRFDGCFSSQPSYKASFGGHATDDNGAVRSPVMKMVGRTNNERQMSGCALIWIQADKMTTRTHSENASDLSFRIHLAQGIDPAFLICFTAIVDEILEKSMRMRCQNHRRRLTRKDSFSLTKERLEARSRLTTDVPYEAEICTSYTNCNFVGENTN
jgi:hypothetical protein